MTADEYRDAIKRLGLTQAGASRFLGTTDVSSRRWATGKVPVPHTVSMLLRLMLAMKLTPEKVQEWLGEG